MNKQSIAKFGIVAAFLINKKKPEPKVSISAHTQLAIHDLFTTGNSMTSTQKLYVIVHCVSVPMQRSVSSAAAFAMVEALGALSPEAERRHVLCYRALSSCEVPDGFLAASASWWLYRRLVHILYCHNVTAVAG